MLRFVRFLLINQISIMQSMQFLLKNLDSPEAEGYISYLNSSIDMSLNVIEKDM